MFATRLNSRALVLLLLAALPPLHGCAPERPSAGGAVAAAPQSPADGFDAFLQADVPPADGFDLPFGDGEGGGSYTDPATGRRHAGWYVATHFAEQYTMGMHTGEDWNGSGGGDTDYGQPVYAAGAGRVRFAGDCGRLWGKVLVVEHLFYENHERRRVHTLYAHLSEIKVREGEEVRRRQHVGSIGRDPDNLFAAHLHFEVRLDTTLPPTYWPSSDGKDEEWLRGHYAEPSSFVREHRKLPVPQRERALVLVEQQTYRMRLYDGGRLQGEYDISLGQGRGAKESQGDNRTPKGVYFVVQKQRGEFPGEYGAFFGGHWIRINYPNRYDARRGVEDKIITVRQYEQIKAAWERRARTLETTRLGGGIGFHGWASEWANAGPRHLSWGCVVLHLSDIGRFYDAVPEGAMVVIF